MHAIIKAPLYISDTARRLFLTPFGISEADIQEALAGPIQIEEIKAINMTLTVVLAPAKPDKPHSALLIQGEISTTALSLEYALRIPDPLARDRQAASPLAMLEAVANTYGVEFNIGDHRAKFMKQEVIRLPVSQTGDVLKVNFHPGAAYVSSSWIKVVEKNGLRIAVCTLCFVLDAHSYGRAVGL